MAATKGIAKPITNIVDIRREELDESLLKLMLTRLNPDSNGPITLPTLLLYDGVCSCMAFSSFSLHRIQRPD